MDKNLPKRKPMRRSGFDYNSVGAYFLTICTEKRRCVLSRVVGTGVLDCPRIQLSNYGEIAEKYIRQLDAFYDHLSVECYVIMPNHIHILLLVKGNGQSGTPVPTRANVPVSGTESVSESENTAKRGRLLLAERANNPLSQFISTFKRFCNKEYGENIWQSRANDHVIRDRRDYEKHVNYISENPMRWRYDELYEENEA